MNVRSIGALHTHITTTRKYHKTNVAECGLCVLPHYTSNNELYSINYIILFKTLYYNSKSNQMQYNPDVLTIFGVPL
jgi:hypothetical protein